MRVITLFIDTHSLSLSLVIPCAFKLFHSKDAFLSFIHMHTFVFTKFKVTFGNKLCKLVQVRFLLGQLVYLGNARHVYYIDIHTVFIIVYRLMCTSKLISHPFGKTSLVTTEIHYSIVSSFSD